MTQPPSGAASARRRSRTPRDWRDTFIAALGETSNVAAAARAARISTGWVYKIRREDAEFRRRWFTALCEGYDNLEMDLLCWLRTGRLGESGAGGAERKFDAATALRVLAAHREAVGKERGRQSMESEAEIIASINARIDAMRSREQAAARLLTDGRASGTGTHAGR
ncbi:hypothetical protein MB02_06465 [Croceicoccus estronivorus]|uniref:hypothetical protein n=1 Tax=Croceicoccus estronivorus TaxID=1172626 RepID=UPI000830E36C|nr:hypothetical protein [Croceicoccus estronivorus]OCC24251.1 hypothetical protein MB02_06465 [Croceicoccus estronivorus]